MEYVRLGKSNLMTSRVAMGAMQLEKCGSDLNAYELVRYAYSKGINFFDTSRSSSKCEQLLGESIGDIRKDVVIATKTNGATGEQVLKDLDTSLSSMHTDYVDLYQYEAISFLPEEDGVDGILSVLKSLKESGRVRSLGIATVDMDIAVKAIYSGVFDTLQFPFSMISDKKTEKLVEMCEENDIGFIAMQPLCGGLVENIPLAFGYLHQFESVIPLWGVQSQEEIQQVLYFQEHPPVIDEKFNEEVERLRTFFN